MAHEIIFIKPRLHLRMGGAHSHFTPLVGARPKKESPKKSENEMEGEGRKRKSDVLIVLLLIGWRKSLINKKELYIQS